LHFGARIDAKDHAGRSPLYCAAEYGCFDSVKVLLLDLANPLLKNNQGKLPVDVTSHQGIVFYLQRAKNLHIINRISNAKFMLERIKNGLKFILEYEDNPLFKKFLKDIKEI
jgi:ankyrin repeat protein